MECQCTQRQRREASPANSNNNKITATTTTAAWHVYCVAFFFVTKLLLEFHIMCIYCLLIDKRIFFLFLFFSLPTVHDLKKNLFWKNRNQSWPSWERRNELVSPANPNCNLFFSVFEFNLNCTVISKWRNSERLYNILMVHFEMYSKL